MPQSTRRNLYGRTRHLGLTGQRLQAKDVTLNSLGSVVYAAQVNDEGLIKIGHTNKLGRRLWDLSYRYWVKPELLAFRFGGHDDEQRLHAALKSSLSHGREWYYPTPEVIAAINQMRSELGMDAITSLAA